MFKKGKKSFAVVISAVLIAALCMFAGCVESADSTSSEPSDCAAKIGKVYYYTVAEAIEAAKSGDTVTLVNDVLLDEGLVINKKVTLSLNGKNISAEGDVEKLISVNEGADLTIIGEGEVTAPDGTRTILFVNGGKVTVEGGKYDGGNGGSYDICVYVVSGEAVLNGGEFTTGVDKDNYANSVIYNNGTGKITINGGYYWTDYAYNGFYYVLNQQNSAAGEIKVYGGTFKNYNPANGDDNLKGNFVAWGYVSMANGDGTTYTVMARPETYEVSTAAELESAIENAIDGNTVKLTADVVIDHTLVIDDDITLDLNGKTISNTSDIWSDDDWSLVSITRCAKVTIDGNGKFLAKENDCYAVDVRDGSELTIESGYFNGNVHAVYVLEGKLTVNGGKFEVQQPYPGAGKEYEFVLNCYDANRKAGTAKIIVYGGEFVKFNPADCKAEGEGTNFVAEGYVSTAKGDGTIYTVMARPETYEAGTEAELESAIVNAVSGNTVKLTADIDSAVDSQKFIVYNIAGITLDLNGKTYSHKNGAHAFEGTGGVIKNGKIVCKGGSYALFVGDEGETTSFTVENVELIGGVNVYNATNVVLKDLNVTAADYYAVWADSAATVTVQGGTYDLGKGKAVFAATKTESGDFISVITVEGNCTAKGNTLFLDKGGKLKIKGGTYEVDPTDYLETGYEVTTSTVEGKTTYTVAAAQNN